jgi:hypothetical protein
MLLRYTITLCHYITLPPLINNSTRAVKRHESKMKDSVVPPELRRNPVPRGHHHALLHGLTRALARQPEPVSKPMPGPAKRLLPCVPPARAGQVRGKKRVVTRPHAAAPRPAPAPAARAAGAGAPLLRPRCRPPEPPGSASTPPAPAPTRRPRRTRAWTTQLPASCDRRRRETRSSGGAVATGNACYNLAATNRTRHRTSDSSNLL